MPSIQPPPTLSFEVFPPQSPADRAALLVTLDQLRDCHPAFVSVTYSNHQLDYEQATLGLAQTVQARVGCPVMVHLLATYTSRAQASRILDDLEDLGLTQILGLRGDLDQGSAPETDFPHASDLIRFIKARKPQFRLAGAGYPAGHPESPTREADLAHLQEKVAAGCDRVMTQVFYDNQQFDRFQADCVARGITVPILAGILPILNRQQAVRVETDFGTRLPQALRTRLDRVWDDPVAFRAVGLDYAVEQITDLVAHGVAGIHLFTLNQASTVAAIYARTAKLFTK